MHVYAQKVFAAFNKFIKTILTAPSVELASSNSSVLIAFLSLQEDNYHFQLDLLYIMLNSSSQARLVQCRVSEV